MSPDSIVTSTLLTIFASFAVIILILAVVFWLTFVWLRRLAREREIAMRQRFPNARVVAVGANFFGQESQGVMQLRGNGTLVITEDALVFERWVARQEYRIPLSNITAVETPNHFLGKSIMKPLLKVVYQTDGVEDAMAWYVHNLSGIKALLEQEIRH